MESKSDTKSDPLIMIFVKRSIGQKCVLFFTLVNVHSHTICRDALCNYEVDLRVAGKCPIDSRKDASIYSRHKSKYTNKPRQNVEISILRN